MRVTAGQLRFLDRIAGMTAPQLRAELSRAHMQIERLQEVAVFDSADIIRRADKEGVDIDNPKARGKFTREFSRKAWT